MATKKKASEEETITASIDDEAVEKLRGLFTSSAPISSSDSKTLTVDPTSGFYTWTTTTPGPWDATYVSPTISATPRDAVSDGATPYADGFLPHLVRAKEEGVRKGIEMDTVVIDRGVAVSIGLDPEKSHVDMILGLRVRYAKEHSLPMDSAFVLLKEKKKEKPAAAKKTSAAKAGMGACADVEVTPEEEEAWKEKEEKCGATIMRRGSTCYDSKRFITFVNSKTGRTQMLAIDKIVFVEDHFVEDDPTKPWIGLSIEYESGGKVNMISIRDPKAAEEVWNDLRTSRIYEK